MATATTRSVNVPTWLGWVFPLALVVVMVAVFLAINPIGSLRPIPPVEAIAVEQTTLNQGEIVLQLRNDGPDPVTVSQVLVNGAYTEYTLDGDNTLGRLETTTMHIPYPWETGLPVGIRLLTSTGATFEHEIEVASLTPQPDGSTFVLYALLGVYIGVVPIAIGLLWFPALQRASKKWLGFFLAFTIGLLAFLFVDTVAEGIELAGETAESLNGLALFIVGALGATIGLVVLETALGRRREDAQGAGRAGGMALTGLALAYLIAGGIGLHNLGEGLAVGAALAAGEVALGTFLILGFAIHNTTEGLAIVSPLGSEGRRPSLWHFVGLGALAGAPTILGAWSGGFAFSPAWAALAFGIAAGAIGQVIWQIGKSMSGEHGLKSAYGALGLMAGLVFMYGTSLLTS